MRTIALSHFIAPVSAPSIARKQEEFEPKPQEEKSEETKCVEPPRKIEPEPTPPKPEVKQTPPEPVKTIETVTPPPVQKPRSVIKPEPEHETVRKRKSVKQARKTKKHSKRKKRTRRRASVAGGSKALAAASKRKFLAKLRARIERAKRYPPMAKRRGLQGRVKVRFTVTASGNVRNITLSGSSLFFSSARKAVKEAFPIDTRGAKVTFPLTVTLTLRYRLFGH
jgi:protein TonB